MVVFSAEAHYQNSCQIDLEGADPNGAKLPIYLLALMYIHEGNNKVEPLLP